MSMFFFFFSSRRRHTRYWRDWSSDVCSSDLHEPDEVAGAPVLRDLDDPVSGPLRERGVPGQGQQIGRRLGGRAEHEAHPGPPVLGLGSAARLAVATRQVVHAASRLTGGRPPRAEWLRAVL